MFICYRIYLLLLFSATSSINTGDLMPLEAIDAHAIALAPLCFTDDVVFFNDELLQIFCMGFLLPIILVYFEFRVKMENVFHLAGRRQKSC